MKGFVQNIEALATKNANFRRVLYTAKHCQLVVMSLHPADEIGMEVHKLDQFFRVEEGSGGGYPRRRPQSDQRRLRCARSGWHQAQHRQYECGPTEALHALCSVTASFIARVRMPRRTTSISTVRRRNRRSLPHVRCSTCRSTIRPTSVGQFRKPRNGSRNSGRERPTWGREPRPMQLLGLALIGGFIAGRNSAGEAIPKGAQCFVLANVS